MKILLCNDDGVHAQGLKAIHKELNKLGKVYVAAPLEEKSTTGHSLTLHKPLRILEVGKDFYGISGSPADCVYIGIKEILAGRKPDLIVSGVNRGANLGQDVYYSGTVSAAREGCIMGIPAIAVSCAVDFNKPIQESRIHYESSAKATSEVIKKIVKNWNFPRFTFLNLNVPDLKYEKLKGIVSTRQGFRFYSGNVLKRKDHRGRNYFWVGGQYKGFKNDPDTDCYAVDHGYASLTPIKLDTTDSVSMKIVEKNWSKL